MGSFDAVLHAYENHEFFLEYMPVVSLIDGRCVGCEALMRWQHGNEVVSPTDFIPLAENSSLSGLLTYWAVEEVAKDLGDWLRNNEKIHVGINVPPELFGRGGVEYAIRKAGIYEQMDKIILEITERGLPDHVAIGTLKKFAGHRKSRIAVDDFGTGDAQLTKLAEMEVDIIKIDMSFVKLIDSLEHIPKIIKATTAFALAMEVELIAEGVETELQAEVLKSLGVHMAQGFLYSHPLKVNDFLNFFEKYNKH